MSTRSARGRRGPATLPADPSAPLGTPLLVLNLKAYPVGLGAGALRMGRALEELGRQQRVSVALAAPASDLANLARTLKIPVLAQHVDARPPGASTGWIVAEALRASGVRGSLLNHSEHPISAVETAQTVERMRANELVPVVCAKEDQEAAILAGTSHPAYLAVEPPELIGGTVSVSKARPEIISRSVMLVRRASPSTHLLCGAGVQDASDVRKALELGAEGILVASAVAKAPDPAAALKDLLSGFHR